MFLETTGLKELLDMKAAEEADTHKKSKQKKSKKQQEEEAEQWRLYEEAKKARAEPWKMRQIRDHSLLVRSEASIKWLQEHSVRRIMM